MASMNPHNRRSLFSAIRARELHSAPASMSTSSGSHALNWAPRLHSRVTDRVSLNVNSYAASYNYGDATCRLWDVMTKKCINVFKGHTSSVKSVAFSMHDPNMVVTGGRDGSVMIWDVRCTGTASGDDYIQKPTHTYQYAHAVSAGNVPITAARKKKVTASNLSSVTAVTYLPNNSNHMASAGASDGSINANFLRLVKFWDIRKPPSSSSNQPPTPAQVSTPPPQTHLSSSNANHPSKKRVYGLCTLTLDPFGAYLFSACKDNSVHAYSTTLLSEPVHVYTSKTLAVSNFYVKTSVSPGPRGGALACASQDGVHVWGLDRIDDHEVSPRPLVVLRGDERGLTSVDWCKTDFEQLATCSDDCVVRVWNVRYPTTEAEEDLGTFDDGNLDGNIEGMRHWVGWAQKVEPDEAVVLSNVPAVSEIGTDADATAAIVVPADIAPSAESNVVSPPASRLGVVHTPNRTMHSSSSSSSSPETVVGSVTPDRTSSQSVEPASVTSFSPTLLTRSRETTLTPAVDQLQESDISPVTKSQVLSKDSTFQPNNDALTDLRCPTPSSGSCSNPTTESQKQLSSSSPAASEIPITKTPSVFEQMMRKREPSTSKPDDPRRKSFPNLSRKRDEKKDKVNVASMPVPAGGASLQKKATLSSQRSFGGLSSGLSANKQASQRQNSPHKNLPLSRQSSTVSNNSKSAALQSTVSNLGKRALSQCSSVGGSLPSLSMQSSCGHSAFRFSSCPFDSSSQDSTFSDTAPVTKRGRTDSMCSDTGIGLKKEMSALSSSKAICGCGCPMVDEEMCKCVFEVSTVSGYDRKGKGLHTGEQGLFCLDLGMNKENICSFHWEKILGMDGRVV
ncbi:hypothetical protein HDU81_004128 [Chytriomyces hyalinus]|nr:hypothetical protein HDU81_004128 [Chytriomyces hyalinus]